jgi:NADH dehydrogenase [ubiquinone] 1 alpha subcomplex assembly factor 7
MEGEPPQAPRSLADTFRRLIEADGPIGLQQFMGESNARYYAHKDPLGQGGDFVTAPEISQMFGELVGLWLADMWLRAGSPADAIYVELGPGRGTLASDVLRAMKRCGLEPRVHLVEGSPALRSLQRAAVPAAQFHDDLGTVPDEGPLLMVANEFLDALPVRQLVRAPEGWREVVVALDAEGRFVPVAGTRPMDAAVPEGRREAGEGALIETCPGAAAVTGELAARLAQRGGAALMIDYGYTVPQSGSTLQAVRAHRKVDAFASPGEADLTAHVDFAAMAEVAQARGATWLGTVEQGPWLQAMGIEQRAAALAAAAPGQRETLALAVERLTQPEQMGELFKVMGLAGPGWKDGAGFG